MGRIGKGGWTRADANAAAVWCGGSGFEKPLGKGTLDGSR